MGDKNQKEEKSSDKLLIIIAILLVILVPLIVVSGLYLYKTKAKVAESVPEITGNLGNLRLSTDDTEEALEGREEKMTYFTGYDSIATSKAEPIFLKNEPDNAESRIYIEYEIYDESDTLIYKSGLIEAGKSTKWDAAGVLSAGTYKLRFHQQPYRMEDETLGLSTDNMTPLYYVDQTVKVTVN